MHLVYFCSDRGECSLEYVPSDQTDILVNLLNDRGADGWEPVQTFFGKDGIVIIRKREVQP